MRTKIINNLNEKKEEIDPELATEISQLIRDNFFNSNRGEYRSTDLEILLKNKTPADILNFMKSGLSIILLDENRVIGFGMIVKKGDIYEAKYLNVASDYKGQGLGVKICDLREQIVKDMGVKELFIESLRFDNTLKFHKKRGFYDIPPVRKLNYTNYMRKDL